MGVCAGALLLVLASCGTLAAQPAPYRGADGRCEPKDPCCMDRLGDQTCDPKNATCFGIDNLGNFADCPTGRLYWTGWTSLDDGLLVQITRPQHHRVGPRRCAKVVITQASNVLGYISKPHPSAPDSCGGREARTDRIFEDLTRVVAGPSWFNVTGTNESLNLDFALLNDLDWKGTNLHVTLRPNQDGNFSNNRTYFEFKISPCNMTGFESDRALWQTALLDAVAAALAFVWVTTAWAFCGGVKQWQGAREERRFSSLYGVERVQGQTKNRVCPCLNTRRDEMSEGLLDHQLEGTNSLLSETPPGRALRGSSADKAAVARFVAAKNAAGGSTFRAKKKLERDLKAGSSTESQMASIQKAIKLAERDIVVERRRKQGEWRARFMASHRFTWPYYVWIEPDSTIVKVAGQRALEYMKFQWAIIRLLIGLSLPTLVLLVINLTGHWCENAAKGEEITQVDQQWGIPLLDGDSDYNNTADYVCRMSSNNVQTRNGEQNTFWAHLIVALYFSVATYAVSKRDILGRTADQSQFIYIFEKLYLDLLVPQSFWWGAHCRMKGTSSYDDNGEADDGNDSESMITVTIAEPTGLVHTVQIGPSATVEELKEQMCKDTVASPQRLQLALDGHILEEEYLSLQDYDLLTGSHLEAVTKTQSIGLTRPGSPTLVRNEEGDPSTPAATALTSVTRPASPESVIATGDAAQPEPEQVLVGGHDTVVALPPRPDAPSAAVGVSRAASPNRVDRPLELAEKMRGGAKPILSGDPPSLSLSPTAAEPFAQSPQTRGSTLERIDLRSTGFEYGHNPQYSPSDTQSMRRRGRDATVDQKRVSPARNALLVRRISTKFEHVEDPNGKKGWLRNTLYKVFHRPEKWKVKDILIYSTGKHGLACFGCRECFKCNECTAFIVFESPEMPLDIIRRHRDATQKTWLVTVWLRLQNICNFCAFVCCPNLRCLAESSDEMGLEMIFGRNKDTDKLGMPHWQLQPGPTKEDLDARADSTGRWKNLNRPMWQLRLSTWFGRAVLFTGSLLIFWSTLMEAVLKSVFKTQQWTVDPTTGNLRGESSSVFFNFLAKYVPTLISFLVIVGILPTLIDLVVYLVEPHYLMSDAYRSVLNKNLVLLLFSSLVLPSLALTRLNDIEKEFFTLESKASGVVGAINFGHNQNDVCHDDMSSNDQSGSVWSGLWSTVRYPVEVMYDGFGTAFGGDVAGYFFRYMTHASLLGLGATLLLMPDKFYRTVSCLLRWKKERRMVWEFPLEYNYSIFCSTFAITLVYAIPHPPVLFLGLLYAILRAFGDKYSLLFAHEGNLDSHFTDADEEGGVDALDGEGVHASASYHAKALNETVHNFLLLTIVIFHVAIYGFLKIDPNGSDRNFQYAEAMLIFFFVSLTVYMRRTCAIRRTLVEDPVPEAVSPHSMSEMPVSGGFGYYVDKDAINMSGRLQLMDDGFTFK